MQKKLDTRAESIRDSEMRIARDINRIKEDKRSISDRESRLSRNRKELEQKEANFYNERYEYRKKEKAIDEREKKVKEREEYLDQDLSFLYRKTKREAETDFEYIYPVTQDLLVFFIIAMVITAVCSGFVTDLIKAFFITKKTLVNMVETLHSIGVIGWILSIVIPVGTVAVIVSVMYMYHRRYWDRASRIFVFSELTICVCAGPMIRKIPFIHINTAVVFIILQLIYFLIRVVIDLKDPLRDLR